MSEEPEHLGRILVVDDEEKVRKIIERDLERWGFIVEMATDGEAMLDRLKRDPLPDVVILDTMMPHMDGFQARERMLYDPRLSEIPIILRSYPSPDNALTLEQHKAMCRDYRIDEFLFSSPFLLEVGAYIAVLNVLSRRRALDWAEHHQVEAEQKRKPMSEPLVIIADDEPEIRWHLARTLKSAGYRTLQVEDGEMLLHEVAKGPVRPDAIVCDIMMPRMDGFQVREQLLADPVLREIPFILLVLRTVEDDIHSEWMSRTDYDAFLFKPFLPDTPIVPVLENVLRRRIGE